MKLDYDFFAQSALEVAPALLGCRLIRKLEDGSECSLIITETEAYGGEEDKACHASRGRTQRTEMLYREPGTIYVYLCYGIHWLLNIVTAAENEPQAVLIRACAGFEGPARLTKRLAIDKSFNGCSILTESRLLLELPTAPVRFTTDKRVGVDYAGEWADKPWRFILTR